MSRVRHNRQVYALLNQARLGHREDRHLIAKEILGRQVDSIADLSPGEMSDLATALSDWRIVEDARQHTGGYTVDAIQHLLNLNIPVSLRDELVAFTTSLGLNFIGEAVDTQHKTATPQVNNPDEKEI